MTILFWICFFIIFYTYIGYGILIYLIIRLRRAIYGKRKPLSANVQELPSCSLVIAAYNEAACIRQKIENTLSLSYPSGLLKIYIVTDGSSDGTPDIIKEYPNIIVLHQPERQGKIAAIDRVMKIIDSEIVVFTDANTILNKDALLEICKCYVDPSVGAVAGEKRVFFDDKADASAAGEGIYWKYESQLKKWDSELYSVVGTAGELFSVRTALFQPVQMDTVLDDFMISMKIAEKGYRIVYQPKAFAVESSSEDVKEELKRKIRIAAGGMQAVIRLSSLMNPFKQPILTFQYLSHRVLRWTITPLLLVALFFINLYIMQLGGPPIYSVLFYLQMLFYALALLGWVLESKQLKFKVAFVPYYFCIMNYAVLAGMVRYFRNKQSAVWDKAKRRNDKEGKVAPVIIKKSYEI